MADNNIIISNRESLHLLDALDFNEDGKISYNDFVQTVLPQEEKKLRTLCTLRDSYFIDIGEKLPYEVEWGLTRVFEQEIKNFRNYEGLRDIL